MSWGVNAPGASPCGCQHAAAGSYEQGAVMQEGSWQNVVMGADTPGLKARGTMVENGPFLHAYLKFRLPGSPKVYLVTARIDLREVEQALTEELLARAPQLAPELAEGAVSGGRIGKRIKRRLKKFGKKIAKSKLIKTVVKVAKKAFNNPLVKGLLSATPMGAAIVATSAAARVAAKAIRGSKKAVNTLRGIAKRARRGDPGAIKAARLVKAGIKLTGIRPNISARAAGATEPEYLAAVCEGCLQLPATSTQVPPLVGCGSDAGITDEHELEAFDLFATSGAFEGVRWLASRLGPHSMVARPDAFSTRDALLLGQQAMASWANR